MKATSWLGTSVHALRGRIGLQDSWLSGAGTLDEPPLRSELFTAEQMAEHGKRLAATHELTFERAPDRLLPRLASNEKVLVDVCALLSRNPEMQRRITPANEWLLDNFYLIEEEIRTAKLHLPPGYSRELPRLKGGPSQGLPRVYDLALQVVSHGDGRIGRGTLSRFVASYQTVKVLKLGELWAVPIMLRLALIENLRRVAVRIAAGRKARDLAYQWADRMLDVAEKDPKGLILVIADMARSDPPMTGPFVAELARRLQGRSAALALPLTWIEQRLDESNQTIEQVVQMEAQHQAAAQVSVSNSIASLRLLGSMDWREFVETLSQVEQTLREDPADVHARMDFATRDGYRHAIEQMAKHSPLPEHEVAEAAIGLAREADQAPAADVGRRSHVGYYLVGDGRPALEQAAQASPPPWQRLRRAAGRRPLRLYAGAIVCLTLLLGLMLAIVVSEGLYSDLATIPSGWWMLAVAAVVLLAASQLAVSLVNWASTVLVSPRPLPRMDFSFGIPPSSRTMVVVPTMLGSEQAIDDLAEQLEVRFLANRDAQLHFALLTDFQDAPEERRDDDDALLRHARDRIEALNRKHNPPHTGAHNGDRFFLFHRPRRWNERERLWMGYERKRGKLADLNALLRRRAAAGPGERFSLIVGDTSQLPEVRYVITLDTDTQLPRDAAWQMVAAMAHPLNRPRFGGTPDAPVVVDGYGILQPRVGVSLPGANRSRYARLFAGDPGIDPYTRAVSDVYQDVFGEGSFIGKGIYDVDAFEHVLRGRLPENRVLSHDLLEGCYARSGLLSDVQVVEEPPARYDTDVKRRHRWIRGDWQIAGWLRRTLRVPVAEGAPEGSSASARRAKCRNPLSALSRAKILDNLRRSLAPAALIALFLLGWTVLQPPWLWTLAGLAILFVPPLIALAADLLRKPEELRPRQHLQASLPSAARQFGQTTLSLACLPYEAAFSLDAIVRTVWRLWFTHRRLLEWQPSSEAGRGAPAQGIDDLASTFARMWVAPALALVTLVAVGVYRQPALAPAAPVLALWFFSPLIVWWLNRPLQRRRTALSARQTQSLRLLSRRTWAFFETFVAADDNFLPPDNMQEHPVERIAHRTSPTNIGLSLLANLSAYDFGYITLGQLVERTRATLNTMDRLDRHEGHFLNWYDTQTLQPLRPRYVSSVDSGNLAGHLLTLRGGLQMLADGLPDMPRLFAGMDDTLRLLQQALGKVGADHPTVRFASLLDGALADPPQSPTPLWSAFDALSACAQQLVDRVGEPVDAAENEAQRWAAALLAQCRAALAELSQLAPAAALPGDAAWEVPALLERGAGLRRLAERAGGFSEMDYGVLHDPARHLLSIGYNVDEHRADSGHYDLLASEIRLTSFVAIAQGHLPQESWFALGRLLTTVDGKPVLLSWSGSMFEYLMPMLVMPSYEHTLLDQTMRAAVERQIAYGRQRGVPWGMSESGYNATDAHLNYQYRAFGVPGLGLKRGLAEDLVVAPYATVMALMVEPHAAWQNLQRLADEGLAGTFGYYEAVDYTPSRLPRGQTSAVVRSYMAHHQGMSLLSLAHLLLDQPMQRRFEADRELQATLLLLQERIPKVIAFHPHTADRGEARDMFGAVETPMRLITTPDTPAPEVQLLSNGRYHVMITNAGAGYSRWRDLAVTRWREDTTCDPWGSFCYLRDTETGTTWSTTHQPTQWKSDHYEAIFTEGRAEFRRRDQGIDAYTEIVVSPEDDIELRRLRISNLSRTRRSIEVTSYAEIVLTPPPADAQHPAFSKLFVQTELISEPAAVLCTRRPRSADEHPPHMFHLMAVHGTRPGPVSHETDRAKFIGRGRSLHAPQAMREAGALSGSAGSVLDPVAATRRVITLEPEQTATIDLVYGMADTREACLALVSKYVDRRLADRVFELSWTHSQVILRQLNASESETQLYARLASSVIYSQPTLRADPSVLLRNRRGQSGLWGYAISGDLPIVLLQVSEAANIELVRQMVQAHAWWRLKGLAVDLVIWNEERDVYRQRLQEQILGLIAAGIEAHVVDRPGGIFVRHAEQISNEDRTLLQAVARAVISDRHGTLTEQVMRKPAVERRPALLEPTHPREPSLATSLHQTTRGLHFYNGFGGYAADGREYIVAPPAGRRPPAPWVNVLANPRFGTVVSEAGTAYTWCENAHELRLTPWHNDPVTDNGGEVIYLRDEDSGQVWHPTSLPAPGDLRDDSEVPPYVARHGFGYCRFDHNEAGVHSELTVFVAMDAAVKLSRLVLRNDSDRPRRLSATGYVEWVLGDQRSKTAPHIATHIAADNGALYARNPYSNDFGDWIGFFDVDDGDRLFATVTCDRLEFIGRNGSLRSPAALKRTRLSGRVGTALDPCAAIQVPFELAPGESREIVFRLGMGRSLDEAGQLVQRFRGSHAARQALDTVHKHWKFTLGAVQVKTPSESLNLLANGWLVYQTLACRMWARSGYYQSGGAFGFRDQLQDAMALVHTRPHLLREHLLLCASRQFVDGDVQHWWHPPSGRGVRTRISDDYLWLPLALCRYVHATNDTGVLTEGVPFLDGRPVPEHDESYYDLPERSIHSASLYQHAVRAVLHGMRYGEHGLPLMGAGDWNDGMNQVGHAGQGESVWLAFFLCEVLRQFGHLARVHGDATFAQHCDAERERLRERIEEHGWDGDWYRRAYFDDGTPLGSKDNPECQIDSIAQSWAVLSGVADPQRARHAMDSMAARLVRKEVGIVQLLDPPFDRKGPNPGYIAGYVPGVRENGGQYTHSAVWAVMAFAALGDAARAWWLMDMIHPLHHGRTPAEVATYKVEPYVVAADVYSVPPHTGRGGWTWYTGSAGWMYRLIVESLLGVRLETTDAGAFLHLRPCLPPEWPGFSLAYRFRDTAYRIDVETGETSEVAVDGIVHAGHTVPLVNDGAEHVVQVRVARAEGAPVPTAESAAVK
ncbi:GH36-type glycosyl hydrolase domain-containing protein [Piscinibacter sp.]|uniref:GH36-type glycosyl hydrolase domain-containing protein n=1 Tax=Piscinibacter sp. TaxID=1903157 RepID=UPI002BE02374|nr:glucoamylase family protein [Albitalea sp.]HUG21622.1 glucoamylase family protein [Albitalea sp.]